MMMITRDDQQHQPQREDEERIGFRTDQGLPRLVARGDDQGMPAVLDQRGQFFLFERAAKRLFPLLDAGQEIFAKLGGDVGRLVGRQVAADGRQIAFDEVHH